MIKDKKEIVCSRAWFEGLLEYAERTKSLSENTPEANLKIALPDLLGYISSAESILKINDKNYE